MKKLSILLCILLVSCLCGCYESEENYLAEVGEENVAVNSDYDKVHDKILTDTGLYRLIDDSIHYIEWSSGKDIPLCNRPNCSHNTEDCNAYLPLADKMYSYGDYIYVIAYSMDMQGISLYRISFDGSEKVELNRMLSFDENDSDISTLTYQFIIYKGYGYFVCNHSYNDLDTEYDTSVYKVKLVVDGKKEELFTVSGYDNAIFFSGTDDQGIYLYHTHIDVGQKPYERMCENYKVNVETGEAECIEELNNKGLYRVHGNKGYYIDNTKYMMYDMDNKVSEVIVDCETDMEVFADDKYMYIDTYIGLYTSNTPDSERKIYIYDYEGNLIKVVTELEDMWVLAIKDGRALIAEDTEEGEVYTVRDM